MNTIAEEYVNFLSDHLVPKSVPIIQVLGSAITRDSWSRKSKQEQQPKKRNVDLAPYYNPITWQPHRHANQTKKSHTQHSSRETSGNCENQNPDSWPGIISIN